MTKVHVYLNFNGNCEEAFLFYEKVFKTTNSGFYRMKDMPEHPDYSAPEEDKNKIMHTSIAINESTLLMGSDCIESFGQKAVSGSNTYIMLDTDTAEEAKYFYQALTEDSNLIEMELAEQFWAELYASFEDKYGIKWMVHYEGNKKMQE